MKALIIEDSNEIIDAVKLCLQLRWPEVEIAVAESGHKGVELVKTSPHEIIILDINLPDIDGFEVLRQVRSFSPIPVVILTVRGAEEDQSRGLEMGADDYIVKPFRPRDLLARVNAVMRRSKQASLPAEVQPAIANDPLTTQGRWVLDLAQNRVYTGKEAVGLTPTESRLLYFFMKNAGQTLTCENLLLEVWGEKRDASGVVRTHIQRLREKLNDRPPKIIVNQRGGGYQFVTPR